MDKVRKISIIIALFAVAILVGADQLTKYIANTNEILLSGDKIMFIKHILSFKLAYNKGAAWSILTGKKFFLVSISLIASVLVIYLIIKNVDFKKNILLSCAFTLIASGAIGNLIDRAFYEEGVIDFLCFEFIDFPIFNVADSCLTVGAVILMVYVVFFYKEPEKKDEKAENVNNLGVEEDA